MSEPFDWEPITNEELKWVGLDFDKTMALGDTPPDYRIQEALPGTVEAIQELVKMGKKPTIFTARHSADYALLEKWCAHYNLPIRRIMTGKPLLLWHIDDRNIEFDPARPEESWARALEIIRTGKLPW